MTSCFWVSLGGFVPLDPVAAYIDTVCLCACVYKPNGEISLCTHARAQVLACICVWQGVCVCARELMCTLCCFLLLCQIRNEQAYFT